jgi:hypothetical protein
MTTTNPVSKYLKTPEILARYQFSKMTLHRWLNRERNPFPKPRIGQQGKGCHNLWAWEDLIAWEEKEAGRGQ